MITGIDHMVILADDLDEAISRFEALGFAVTRGGSHPAWGTENALIPLADGSYLELLAARDPELARQHRLWQRADGSTREPGSYGGYALGSDDIDSDVLQIRARGLWLTDPQAGSRRRPDGQMVRWQLAFSDRPDLPFLIEDETHRGLRIASPERGLGTDAGIDEVVVAVDDLPDAARAYEQLLDIPSTHAVSLHGPAAHFQTPRGRIVLIPRPGPGVFSVMLGAHRWTESTQAVGRRRLSLECP